MECERSSAADAEECKRGPKDASVRCFASESIRINYIYEQNMALYISHSIPFSYFVL